MKICSRPVHFSFISMLMLLWLSGCKPTVSKERAKDYVNDYINYNNTEMVGGNTMKNAEVAIQAVDQVTDSIILIHYTWSGIVKAPPLGEPQPDRTVTNEPGILQLHLKNDKWVFTDE